MTPRATRRRSPPRSPPIRRSRHVGLVYSETGSGVVHDVAAVGAVVRAAGRRMIVDAVSAFGALPLDLSAQPEIDAAVFTANKCLEGMPGLAFASRASTGCCIAPAMRQAGRSILPTSIGQQR